MKVLIFAALALTVAGCSTLTGTSTTTQTQQIETACSGASAALEALTLVAPHVNIPASDSQAITSAASVITPLCTSPTPPTYSTAQLAALQLAVTQLTSLQVKYAPANGTQ